MVTAWLPMVICTGSSYRAVECKGVVFGLEALLTRVSRAQWSAIPFFPQLLGCYWLPQPLNQFLTFFSFCVALGNYCFVQMSSSIFSCFFYIKSLCGGVGEQGDSTEVPSCWSRGAHIFSHICMGTAWVTSSCNGATLVMTIVFC